MTTKRFDVYASKVADVRKKLDKLANKASKYGNIFSYEIGETFPKGIKTYRLDPVSLTLVEDRNALIFANAVPVTINYEPVKMDGWEVLAQVEVATEGPNQVDTFGEDYDPSWHFLDGHCDHCQQSRRRTHIYVVRKDGVERQVGKTCLRDYTGIDPAGLITWAEIHNVILDKDYESPCLRDYEDLRNAYGDMYVETRVAVALAYDIIKKRGYCKSGEKESTKGYLWDDLMHCETPSEEGLSVAEKAISWLTGNIFNDQFSMNLKAAVSKMFVDERKLGFVAFVPVAYERYLETQRPKETSSRFVGNVGDRVEITIDSTKLLSTWTSQYQYNAVVTTELWRLTDNQGNVYLWKTQNPDVALAKVIKATVKEHTVYKGEQETVITRGKIVA